jgi:membrane protein DedA with SNARE-associated domain/rhodanese-related sulfurtransferase
MTSDSSRFLVEHGAPFLFGAVFVDQVGIPIPALPWLLAVGALSATHQFNPLLGIIITLAASLAADALWFYLGRYRGAQVMGLLCRISLEPDSCVRRTQNLFSRYGLRGVIVAKFVPGLRTMAPPLAGMSGVSAARFFIADGAGAVLFGACFIGLGFVFSNQIEEIGSLIARIGGSALVVVASLAALYIGFKFVRRHLLLRKLAMARITVEELRQKQAGGENLVILDLRSVEELMQDPTVIQGAVHWRAEEVEHRQHEIPRDRDVILYCSCPNEITSAKVALLLHRRGITRVRPLLGGIDAWRKLNYPLEVLNRIPAAAV